MQDHLLALAKTYSQVYVTNVSEFEFIWRPITRQEYRMLMMETQNQKDLEDLVCNTAVISPEVDFAEMPAGYAKTLAPIIVEESGYGGNQLVQQLLERSRQMLEQLEPQAEATIRAAFPSITFEEMANWSGSEFIFRLAQAEWVLKNIYQLPVSFDKQPEPEPLTPEQMRENGIDPMTMVDPHAFRPPFIERPVVGGVRQWKEETVYDAVQRQVLREAPSPTTRTPEVPGEPG